jgi:hypothetical protein
MLDRPVLAATRPSTQPLRCTLTPSFTTQVIAGYCVEATARETQSVLLGSKLLAVYGQWQCEGEVRHLVAQHLVDPTPLLGWLAVGSRDFR